MSDVATTVLGRMGHPGVKYVTCSSVLCDAQAERGGLIKELLLGGWPCPTLGKVLSSHNTGKMRKHNTEH